MPNRVLVIGGTNIDIKAKTTNVIIQETSNIGTIEISAGGVARNIAQNLSHLGVETILLSVIGEDAQGIKVLEDTKASGVNVEHVLISNKGQTGTYNAVLNNNGQMLVGVAHMDIFEEITEEYVASKEELIKTSKYIICDANIPSLALEKVLTLSTKHSVPVLFEPVSVAKSLKVRGLLEHISIITPNKDELEAITGKSITAKKDGANFLESILEASRWLIKHGVDKVITTLGKDGICYVDKNQNHVYKSFDADVVDVTGAGDSLTAGLIFGFLQYEQLEMACKCGLAAAAITIQSKDTVSNRLNIKNIEDLIKTHNN